MLIKNESLYLYNLTLKPPGLSIGSIVGQFTGNRKTQEIVIAYPGRIELWVADPNNGKLKKHFSEDVFGCIQSIDKIRAVGSQKDLLVIASDSGKLTVAEWKDESLQFIPLYQEPHSKTGMRRTSPGEYLCIDPQNRAILLGTIETNKLIYRSQTNDKGFFQISSPIESSMRHILTLNMCALDTGYENPVFAAIECSYDDQNNNRLPFALDLNYYELDQGLNHLVKRKADSIPLSVIHLVPLPGYIGGIIVCCESFLIYDHPYKQRLYLPLPTRTLSSKTIILNHVVHRIRKNDFFILLQSHLGDCFKINVYYDDDNENINNISISYFDTIPLATSLNILKSGFLFANAHNGNKLFYQFESLGDDSDICLNSNSFPTLESASAFDITDRYFQPAGLRNLALVDIMETLNPLTGGTIVEAITSESLDPLKQVVLSSNSHLKTLTRALPVSIIASSQLPINATHIFASKLFKDSENDEYLILSSATQSQTLVLSIGEVVEEVSDSEYVMDQPTIGVQQVGKSSTIQIYSSGIRHVRQISENGKMHKKTTDWYTPAGISIVAASANNEQVVIGLSNREVCYFEIDASDDQLVEYQERLEVPSGSITAVAIADSSKSKQKVKKSNYAVVGCSDDTIQIISLRRENCLEIVSMQALSSRCSSLVIVPLGVAMFIHIGMANGLYVRVTIDGISGKISDTQVKFLGSREVNISPLGLSNSDLCGVLCNSSRPWLGLPAKDSYDLIPLMNSSISCGTSFYSDNLGFDVVVGIENETLTIFTIGNYGSELSNFVSSQYFHTQTIRLRYLPRKLIVKESSASSASTKFAYIAQCERGIESPFPTSQFGENGIPYTEECAVDQDYYDAFGYKRVSDSWASCVQVINLNTQEIIQTVQFEKDECVSCIACVKFDSNLQRTSRNLVVSIRKDENTSSAKRLRNYLYTFNINAAAETDSSKVHLSLLHRTEIDLPTGDMIPFDGKLLISMGNYLRLYDYGQRQLLRKASSNIDHLDNIVKLTDQGGGRIVVGDSTLSTTFVRFDELENKFIPFADDIMKRHLTTICTLDHDTIIGGDKFGNVFVSRVPEFVSQGADNDWCLTKYQDSYLNGSGNRIKNICEFYLQDIPTSFAKGSLVVGGRESIIYSGIQGTLGMLIPLSTLSEVKFFNELQIVLRDFFNYNFDDFDKDTMGYNLIGKDHLKFRSYYNPVKNVLDGDLIDRFFYLNLNSKLKLANKLGRSPKEIERKISDIKNRSAS